MANPIRLDQELLQKAEVAGKLQHRTVPKQIEYWAEIGRRVAEHINMEDLLAISQGLKTLKVESRMVAPVDFDALLETVAVQQNSAESSAAVTRAQVRYQRHPRFTGYLEAIYADGRRETGILINGQFTKQEPHAA